MHTRGGGRSPAAMKHMPPAVQPGETRSSHTHRSMDNTSVAQKTCLSLTHAAVTGARKKLPSSWQPGHPPRPWGNKQKRPRPDLLALTTLTQLSVPPTGHASAQPQANKNHIAAQKHATCVCTRWHTPRYTTPDATSCNSCCALTVWRPVINVNASLYCQNQVEPALLTKSPPQSASCPAKEGPARHARQQRG
jgi:hypothetical protein